jgi:hypothetical protein
MDDPMTGVIRRAVVTAAGVTLLAGLLMAARSHVVDETAPTHPNYWSPEVTR